MFVTTILFFSIFIGISESVPLDKTDYEIKVIELPNETEQSQTTDLANEDLNDPSEDVSLNHGSQIDTNIAESTILVDDNKNYKNENQQSPGNDNQDDKSDHDKEDQNKDNDESMDNPEVQTDETVDEHEETTEQLEPIDPHSNNPEVDETVDDHKEMVPHDSINQNNDENRIYNQCTGGSDCECMNEYPTEDCQHFKEATFCSDSLMRKKCARTCGNCAFNGAICEDLPVSKLDCATEKAYGNCDMALVQNYCARTCEICTYIDYKIEDKVSGEIGVIFETIAETRKVYEAFIIDEDVARADIKVEILTLNVPYDYTYCSSKVSYVEIVDIKKEATATEEQKRLCSYDGCIRLCSSFAYSERPSYNSLSSDKSNVRVRYRPQPGQATANEGFTSRYVKTAGTACTKSEVCNGFPEDACNSNIVKNACPCLCASYL